MWLPSENDAELERVRRDLDSMRRSRDELSARHDALRADMEKLRAEKALAILQGRALELADVLAYIEVKSNAPRVISRSVLAQGRTAALSELANELRAHLHEPVKP